jgi:hypothetical protein
VRTIGELAQFVTRKNAGPFLLTLDIVFADEARSPSSSRRRSAPRSPRGAA